ncbi:MAG: hypothetical protein K2X82_08500 [Gemmataceae bacterium]|nr:hypothetical protein [Gemmataceae bacterium]
MTHPFYRPNEQRVRVGGQLLTGGDSPDPAQFGRVATVPSVVTGGLRYRWTEVTFSAAGVRSDAPNADSGFAVTPTAFGTVALGDTVKVNRLPLTDDWLGTPAGGGGGGGGFLVELTGIDPVTYRWAFRKLELNSSGVYYLGDSLGGGVGTFDDQFHPTHPTGLRVGMRVWATPAGEGLYKLLNPLAPREEFYAEITANAGGAHSWKQKVLNTTTYVWEDADPPLTGTSNAYCPPSEEGPTVVPVGRVVRMSKSVVVPLSYKLYDIHPGGPGGALNDAPVVLYRYSCVGGDLIETATTVTFSARDLTVS